MNFATVPILIPVDKKPAQWRVLTYEGILKRFYLKAGSGTACSSAE